MVIDSWGRHHQKLAKILSQGSSNNLPKLPSDILPWINEARPFVDNNKRDFRIVPFWLPIYQDDADFVMVMGGRQIFKSTACTDFIAKEATTKSGIQICYVTHDEKNLSAFSKQKLRVGTFLLNPVLYKFLRHPGNVGEISLKNNSTIYLLTDNYQYRHVEGKSPTLCVIDEAQYQDIEHVGRVNQTMMATKGKLRIFGIGGESGSAYEKLWMQTNQMEWYYDDPNWRERLQFGDASTLKDGEYLFGRTSLIVGNYLADVLKGKWVPQNPDATMFHGYHIPQTIFPSIPLTEDDAVTKYKIHPRFSIQYQKKELPESEFQSHVLGTFYNSPHRPITREMVLQCMTPYRRFSLLSAREVTELKMIYGNEITIGMGVDFGSGSSSVTAIAIVMLWQKSNRVQLAFIEKRPQENQMEQAEYIAQLFKDYSCDIGVGDLGYGANQVKLIQDGGHSVRTGAAFSGVSATKFIGSRTVSDITKPLQIFNEKTDEHGDQVGRIQIDKTSNIDLLVGSMQKKIYHPRFESDTKKSRLQLMIPSLHDYETGFLVDDLTSITRKDISYLEDVIEDARQHPVKEYNHPKDSVMALVYALVSLEHLKRSQWRWA
ncbi:MAG: hypothetical protein WD154_04805 [Nitrosopumilaceae archaeon]